MGCEHHPVHPALIFVLGMLLAAIICWMIVDKRVDP